MSPELIEVVVNQFDKGYQSTKAKIRATSFDPVFLDFSDDEEGKESETEINPPTEL